MLIANSLIKGFCISNFIGQMIVLLQLLGATFLIICALGKFKELFAAKFYTTRFIKEFASGRNVLDYYLQRRPNSVRGIVRLYKDGCERLMTIISPDVRSRLVGRQTAEQSEALTPREIELVRGTCEHVLDEEEIKNEHGMGIISTIVTAAPMLGLLGTVWGVLDAFDEMGTAGSANLATIAPSISAALVTTVVGLIVAIPGTMVYCALRSKINKINSDMEGFADELIGRIACEFQGRGV